MHTAVIATADEAEHKRIEKICRLCTPPLDIVGSVSDAQRLAQFLYNKRPEIAVISLELAGWEGLTRAYRESSPGFVYLLIGDSALFCYEIARLVIEAGASAYLLRPLDDESLTSALTRAMLKREFLERHLRLPELPVMSVGESFASPDSVRNAALAECIERYIIENHTEPLVMEDLVRHFYVSEALISRILMKYRGKSFKKLFMNARLEHARTLLKTQPLMNVAEIALAVGYNDPLYFSRIYKAYTGVSPSLDR